MSASTVARRYAEALADAAIARNQLDQVEQELRGFAELMKSSNQLLELIASPIVSQNDKAKVLDAIIERVKPGQLTTNLLRLLLKHYRLHQLAVIAERFSREVNKRKGIAIVEVSTALPVASPDQASLSGSLERLLGKKVHLQFKTDASLIGGVVTRTGSTVYDGSIRTQLQEIKQRLREGDDKA
jgi:F-type H+-transporting ATPase subunit delta